MRIGDGIFTTNVKDERSHGWVSYKAPEGKRFVFLLLGTVEKDAQEFDVDARLEELGWFYRDSGSDRNGENPERSGGVEGEVSQSGAAKTAHRPDNPSHFTQKE